VCKSFAQLQDPELAVQLSHDFDESQGRLSFFGDNRDFCDYYLYISFIYTEGFEGITTGAGVSITVSPGKKQVMSYRVRKDAQRYSYNYQYAMYRGNHQGKPNIDYIYSLPVADKEYVTALVTENRDGFQLAFDMPSDTVYACRGGIMCDDELKDNTAKGFMRFNDNSNLSQITIYHDDGTFGEYIFKGKALIYPGENIKQGKPIAVIDRTFSPTMRFSAYFLDKNKLKNKNIGNKHTHFRPFFQTVTEGKIRLENDHIYQSDMTDEVLLQEMSKSEKKKFLKQKEIKTVPE